MARIRIFRVGSGFIIPTAENHVEDQMEHEMESGMGDLGLTSG